MVGERCTFAQPPVGEVPAGDWFCPTCVTDGKAGRRQRKTRAAPKQATPPPCKQAPRNRALAAMLSEDEDSDADGAVTVKIMDRKDRHATLSSHNPLSADVELRSWCRQGSAERIVAGRLVREEKQMPEGWVTPGGLRRSSAPAGSKAPEDPYGERAGGITVDLTLSDQESEHEASAPVLKEGEQLSTALQVQALIHAVLVPQRIRAALPPSMMTYVVDLTTLSLYLSRVL